MTDDNLTPEQKLRIAELRHLADRALAVKVPDVRMRDMLIDNTGRTPVGRAYAITGTGNVDADELVRELFATPNGAIIADLMRAQSGEEETNDITDMGLDRLRHMRPAARITAHRAAERQRGRRRS